MKDHKLRILMSSNPLWAPSGYAQQVQDFVPLIAKEGYPISMSNFYGQEGGSFELAEYPGIKQYPKLGDVWGADAMFHHGQDFKADVVMTLQDLWVLDLNVLRTIPKFIPIVPIDHDPIPAVVFDRLKLAYRVISMSKFGQQELKRLGMHSTYIPHTVNMDIYKKYDKATVRNNLGLPQDWFIFGMVSANKDNPPRKSFQEVMDAFVMFLKNHPKSALYFHTLPRQNGGFPIDVYAKYLGIGDRVFYTPEVQLVAHKMGKSDMAKLYSAFDCLLCPSTNEGFGVPIIEAQACEVPVIVNNFTAMPEHVIKGETGEICDVSYKRFTPLNSYIGIPDVKSLHKCMEKIHKSNLDKMGKKARSHIHANYSLDGVWKNKWVPFLSKLENEIYPQLDNK